MANENFSFPFMSGVLLGGLLKQKTEQPKKEEKNAEEQFEEYGKYINLALSNADKFTVLEAIKLMQLTTEIGEACKKICEAHDLRPESDIDVDDDPLLPF
jgi:hypothetical protein